MPYSREPHPVARPTLMSRINATAILELVRREGPISRADIARRLALSGSTVTRLTGELIEAGLILERPEPGVSSGGRPPILLSFNQRAATVVGVDVGGTTTTAALSDLNGAILVRQSIPSRPEPGRPIAPAAVIELIGEIIAQARAIGLPVRGVGIGAPSITRHRDGVVVLAPALGWQDVPLGSLAAAELKLPVFVENDVNLAALGEHRDGAGRDTRSFVALMVGTGVGAGIIIDGQLYRGARDAAGEIGYLLVDRSSLEATYPGFGHFESVAGGYGIAAQAQARLAGAGGADGWPADLTTLSARDVFARHGRDPVATELVIQAIDYIAIAVANIACLLNPERVVLGGGVVDGNPWLVETVRDRLRERIPDLPEIVPSALRGSAVLVGAIALARDRTSGYAFVETVEAAGRD